MWARIGGMFVDKDWWYLYGLYDWCFVCGLGLVVCLWTRIGGMFVG